MGLHQRDRHYTRGFRAVRLMQYRRRARAIRCRTNCSALAGFASWAGLIEWGDVGTDVLKMLLRVDVPGGPISTTRHPAPAQNVAICGQRQGQEREINTADATVPMKWKRRCADAPARSRLQAVHVRSTSRCMHSGLRAKARTHHSGIHLVGSGDDPFSYWCYAGNAAERLYAGERSRHR